MFHYPIQFPAVRVTISWFQQCSGDWPLWARASVQ